MFVGIVRKLRGRWNAVWSRAHDDLGRDLTTSEQIRVWMLFTLLAVILVFVPNQTHVSGVALALLVALPLPVSLYVTKRRDHFRSRGAIGYLQFMGVLALTICAQLAIGAIGVLSIVTQHA